MMSSENQKLTQIDHGRVDTLINLFMVNAQKRSQEQHTNMFSNLAGLCNYLGETEILIELEKVDNSPVDFFVKMKQEWFTDEQIKRIDRTYTLSELDFIYFRDTSYPNKLKKSYKSARRKTYRDNSKIYLSEVIIVMSFIRKYLFNKLFVLAKKYNLEVKMIILPQTSNFDPMEAVGIERTFKAIQ